MFVGVGVVWFEGIPYRAKPAISAFRVDGAKAMEGDFLVQMELREVTTGSCQVLRYSLLCITTCNVELN